jgi:hypothetical protein
VQADWKQFAVKKLSNKIIPSYDMAAQKEQKAKFTLSIDSDAIDEELHSPKPLKPYTENVVKRKKRQQLKANPRNEWRNNAENYSK